jgi:hypothetical protein
MSRPIPDGFAHCQRHNEQYPEEGRCPRCPTFKIRVRGRASFITAEYRCEEHGVFETTVARNEISGDPPASHACPECGLEAPWTISAPGVHTKFVISVSRGKNDPKPHPFATDTRSLGEGQPYREWKAGRKKLFESDRRARVKRLLE